jgi:DNA uptake protein ComE-like DNA-binding protein
MVLNIEPIKNWFGYSRRERRASFILLLIIVAVISLRYIFPDRNTDIEDVTMSYYDLEKMTDYDISEKPDTGMVFNFDPNLASYDTLLMLGLTEKAARTLMSYRNSGGKFNIPSDITKVYGIDKNRVEKLKRYVKFKHDSVSGIRYASTPQKTTIDINKCDSATLVKLPGIGPVLSVRIIKYRTLLGGFARVEQLKEVYGLPEETYEMIRERVFADTSGLRKININSSGYRELSHIHYLENYDISAILKYRSLTGRINSIEDLKENKILTPETAEKVEPYMDFR